MYILDITPPYIKVIETGEHYENLPKFGLIVDASLWILAMICQLLTRTLRWSSLCSKTKRQMNFFPTLAWQYVLLQDLYH